MENEKIESGTEGAGCTKGCCCCGCCGGKKMFAVFLAGLLLAGAGFGLYQAGKCAGKVCPMTHAQPSQK